MDRRSDKLLKKTKKLINWSQIVKDGRAWNDLVQRTKSLVGLCCLKKNEQMAQESYTVHAMS